MTLYEKIKLERHGIMQLRARGLDVTRRNRHEEIIRNLEAQLKYNIDANAAFRLEIENVVLQRDNYARLLQVQLGLLPQEQCTS